MPAMTVTEPPCSRGEIAYFIAFSTSGCSSSDGTRADSARSSTSNSSRSRSPKAQLLDAEVEVERVEFLAQRDLLHRVLVERVAQELRQPGNREICGAILAVQHECRDRIQRIEEEMRVELVAQHLELRFLGKGGLLERRLALELQSLVELHAVVKARPAQEQRHRGQRADEDLERLRRKLDRPVGLDDRHVGRIDDRAPGERDDPADERRADQHRARARGPEPPVEPAQRRREQESGGRRDRDHLDVAGLLAIDRRTDELGEPVRAPAERVQTPEQQIAVAAQEVEIHPHNLFMIAGPRATPQPARGTAGRRSRRYA